MQLSTSLSYNTPTKPTANTKTILLQLEEMKQQLLNQEINYFKLQETNTYQQQKIQLLDKQLQLSNNQKLDDLNINFDGTINEKFKKLVYNIDMNDQVLNTMQSQFGNLFNSIQEIKSDQQKRHTLYMDVLTNEQQKFQQNNINIQIFNNQNVYQFIQNLNTEYNKAINLLANLKTEKDELQKQLLIQQDTSLQQLKETTQSSNSNIVAKNELNDVIQTQLLNIEQLQQQLSKYQNNYQNVDQQLVNQQQLIDNLTQHIQQNQQLVRNYKQLAQQFFQPQNMSQQQHNFEQLINRCEHLKTQLQNNQTVAANCENYITNNLTYQLNFQSSQQLLSNFKTIQHMQFNDLSFLRSLLMQLLKNATSWSNSIQQMGSQDYKVIKNLEEQLQKQSLSTNHEQIAVNETKYNLLKEQLQQQTELAEQVQQQLNSLQDRHEKTIYENELFIQQIQFQVQLFQQQVLGNQIKYDQEKQQLQNLVQELSMKIDVYEQQNQYNHDQQVKDLVLSLILDQNSKSPLLGKLLQDEQFNIQFQSVSKERYLLDQQKLQQALTLQDDQVNIIEEPQDQQIEILENDE